MLYWDVTREGEIRMKIDLRERFCILLLCLPLSLINANAGENDLCEVVRQFANSTTENKQKFVELTTNWGIRKTGDTISLAQKQCFHDGSDEGKSFCKYLNEHSSSEFPEMNFRHMMRCLQGRDPFDRGASVTIRDIKVSLYESAFLEPAIGVTLALTRKNDEVTLRIETTWGPQ